MFADRGFASSPCDYAVRRNLASASGGTNGISAAEGITNVRLTLGIRMCCIVTPPSTKLRNAQQSASGKTASRPEMMHGVPGEITVIYQSVANRRGRGSQFGLHAMQRVRRCEPHGRRRRLGALKCLSRCASGDSRMREVSGPHPTCGKPLVLG